MNAFQHEQLVVDYRRLEFERAAAIRRLVRQRRAQRNAARA